MSHDIIKNIIPFNKKYIFIFVEDSNLKFMHPVSNYFLKINDLSINLVISLKWIRWGYFFFNSLSKELKIYTYSLNEIIVDSLQGQQFNLIEKNHILIIDNEIVENEEKVDTLLDIFYSQDFFDENTKIHIKLKLNLRDYLIISNLLFPALSTFE